ncbi:MAG: GH3 auxin-responsive promoter family protein [Bacteroidales bacterium]|nr:GH3 auxin-responsive promoter family protein [Bacteroidales bacterium]
MQGINTILRYYFSSRQERLSKIRAEAIHHQNQWFDYLMEHGARTFFGQEHGLSADTSYDVFARDVPLHDYASLVPYFEKIMHGENNVLWDSSIRWMAKSSGTTAGKSKFIPVSKESLDENHYLASRDVLTSYCLNHPQTQLFAGKGLVLGGSMQSPPEGATVQVGDVSAILLNQMPRLGDFLKASSREVLLLPYWEEKLTLLAQDALYSDITSLSGVPSWMLLVMKKVLQLSGKQSLNEVWPHLEVFLHGGVSFTPYIEEYQKIIPDSKMSYLNMYNASEGFFGFQDQVDSDELLLLSDHGVFYELLPMTLSGEVSTSGALVQQRGQVIPLEDAVIEQNYALIISTLSGLWRYVIGDTIMFTSTQPYRFRITGRTTCYINTFGEELIMDNAEQALRQACNQTGATVLDYTVAPVFLSGNQSKACHEWLIEFASPPNETEHFTSILDTALKAINSDYEAKRSGDLLLQMPLVKIAPKGTFHSWLSYKNKLGGQHKVPRLRNDRDIIDEIYRVTAL